MSLGTMVVSQSGADPVWHGGPSRNTISIINIVTDKDEEENWRYRRGITSPWLPLRTKEDFADLNYVIRWMRERLPA